MSEVESHMKVRREVENVMFWSPSQLSLIQAMDEPYMILPSYFSTGKTSILMKRAQILAKRKQKVIYAICMPYCGNRLEKMALTLQLEQMFLSQKAFITVIQIFVRYCDDMIN